MRTAVTTMLLASVALPRIAVSEVGPGAMTNSLGTELVRIPAGSFWRGSPQDEPGRAVNEGPRRRVRISRPFYLASTETTVAEFAAFVNDTGYVTEAERDLSGGFGIDFRTGRVVQMAGLTWRDPGFPGHQQTGRHPVLLVSWRDAEAFCLWLSAREEATYRLPTEAEWEYAARAGSESLYWSGETSASLKGVANVADAALAQVMPAASGTVSWSDGYPFTAPVASFAPNPFGLHDVHGNVWEWTSDWYGTDAFARAADSDPMGPAEGSFRTIRGGGWFDGAARNRSAQRIYFSPRFRYCLLSGFRVLLEP